MATADTLLTPGEVAQLLAEGGWYRSTGLGSGTHFRRVREHLRVWSDGSGRYHVDAIDPAERPLTHLVVDAGPPLVACITTGATLGVLWSLLRS